MINKGLYTSLTDEWETPQNFFDDLDAEFHFTLDVCATTANAKCSKFYTKADNGLTKIWSGERVFCNPPYGKFIGEWVRKCRVEADKGTLVVGLLPARTDTRWFHEHIYQKSKEIRFIKGRLKFGNSKNSAPFPSMIIIF